MTPQEKAPYQIRARPSAVAVRCSGPVRLAMILGSRSSEASAGEAPTLLCIEGREFADV